MADKTIGDLSSILGADLNSEDIVHIKRASSGTEFKCTLQEFLNGLVNAVGATVLSKLLNGIQLGDGSEDRNIQFASDANLLWDESEDEFNFDKKISTPSLNTGQGDNKLYDMNQNVKTNSNVQFNNVTVDGRLRGELYSSGQLSIDDGERYVLPRGIWTIRIYRSTTFIQARISGTWVNMVQGTNDKNNAVTIISDGSSFRIENVSGATQIFPYTRAG